jgi:hypothetical protein
MATSSEARFELITRNLQEVLGADIIKSILEEGRNPKCYWGMLRNIYVVLNPFINNLIGTAPTGRREL